MGIYNVDDLRIALGPYYRKRRDRCIWQDSREDMNSEKHCPECGEELIPEGGCVFCPNCGYSPCK